MEGSSSHSKHSAHREKLVEHLVLGEVLKASWLAGQKELEVLKPEVDAAGYDVLIEAGGIVRYVQLKSSFRGSRTSRQNVHSKLAEKPGGCVLWVFFDRDTLELGPFLWLGGRPGERLPELSTFRSAKHTKGDAQGVKKKRPALKVVPKGQFNKLESVREVLEALFGITGSRSQQRT